MIDTINYPVIFDIDPMGRFEILQLVGNSSERARGIGSTYQVHFLADKSLSSRFEFATEAILFGMTYADRHTKPALQMDEEYLMRYYSTPGRYSGD